MKNDKLNEMYSIIAEELAISSAVFDDATTSYKAVGEYLSNNLGYEVDIYPHGAMEKNLKSIIIVIIFTIIIITTME